MTARSASSTPLAALAALFAVGVAMLFAPTAAHAADATAPTLTFGSWAETSPYAHYERSQDADRIYFNPLFSGSATASVVARDPETGVKHVLWPEPPLGWSPAASPDTASSNAPGLLATFWDESEANAYPGTLNFTGASVRRIDPNVDVTWGTGSPDASIGVNTYSARWTGKLTAPEGGTYYFQVETNDGAKVFVNGQEVVSYWDSGGGLATFTQCAGGTSLAAGSVNDVVVEYYEGGTNTAGVELRWRLPSQSAAYQAPTGCVNSPADRIRHASGMTGGGSATYPVIPASAFTIGGGAYSRTFSWNAASAGGTVSVTADNNDSPADTSAATPLEFVADQTPPVAGGSGALDFQQGGWGTDGSNTLVFPRADLDITDTGASSFNKATITRVLQRRDGVASGNGLCDTSGASGWVAIGTPAAAATSIVNGIVSIPAPGVCSEFRYRITDAVGNTLDLYASGFRGWDAVDPGVTVTSIDEGTNPQYQHVAGPNTIFFNGTQAGTFTVNATPTDAHSAPYQVRFNAPGNGWIAPTAAVDTYDPGPYSATYEWGPASATLGAQAVRVVDYAQRFRDVSTHTITRDVTGPTGGAFVPGDGTVWEDGLSVDVAMTATMGDGTGAGVASYQLQRAEAALSAGACDPFTGTYANVGAPVYGNPPPPLSGVTDTSVVDGRCYRYRIEATDNVGNVGYATNTNSVRIDDTDPVATLDTLPATASGTITLGGTAADSSSGVVQVRVRLEDMSNPGPTVTIHTDTTATPTWGPYGWDTTALDGSYRLHVDVTDAAGNVAVDADTHDILLDNSAPTIVHTGFVEGTNPEHQHVDPVVGNHRAWVRTTGIGADTPSIIATFDADDAESGIDHVTTPAAPGGATPWTPTTTTNVQDPGPYDQQYSWADGVAPFGTRSATATSTAGKTSTPAAFTILADDGAPTGGSIAPQLAPGPTWHAQPTIGISIAGQVDPGSGIAQQRVERDEVPRSTTGDCATAPWPGTFATTVGTPSATPPATVTDSSITHGMCYRYRLTAVDNVGNTRTIPSTFVHVATDLVAPIATIDTTTPSSPWRGTETLVGTSTDGAADGSNSGVANVTLRWRNLTTLATGTIGTDTGAAAAPTWSLDWDTTTGATPDGSYRILVDVTDVAGTSVLGIATRDVVVDNSPPDVALASFVEGSLPQCQHWSGLPSLQFHFSTTGVGCGASDFTVNVTATDAPGGVQQVRFPSGMTGIAPDRGTPSDDAAAPYDEHYTYTTSAGDPGAAPIEATGNSGATSTLATVLNRDDDPPSGHAITPPGGTSAPAWWSSAPAPSVAFDVSGATDTGGAGLRGGAHVLERREAPGPDCDTWSGYTPVGTPGLSSPYADATVADGTCYQYQLAAYDNVNNRAVATSSNELHVDQTDPSGTFDPVPPYVSGPVITLSGTSGDDWSGVASIAVRLGAGPATACSPAVAASWSCTWDTTTATNGPTTLVLVVTDVAGNVLDSVTQPTYVDNVAPTGDVTITEGTNPAFQHVVPGPTPRVYVNTTTGFNGDFTASIDADDAHGGVLEVTFAELATGWTHTPTSSVVPSPGPYARTYAWSGSATTEDPGLRGFLIDDVAGNTHATFAEVVADTTAPADVTLDYEDGPAPTPSVTFDQGNDAGGAGIATWRIERRQTTVTGPNTCDTGSWSTWTTAATDPASSPWTDGAALLNECYQYRIVVVDNVGNVTTVADASNDTVTSEPAGLVIVESSGTTDVAEGGATDTYALRLRTRPTADVVVTLGPDTQLSTGPTTRTFTSANWNVVQTVTVTAVDDDVDDADPHPGTITHLAASSDADYDGLAGASVTASIADDDTAGIVVSPDQGSVAVLEAGATSDTYTIRLQSQPTADVTVTLGTTDSEVAFAPAALTFTSTNWNAAQVVTVTAVDDDHDEVPDAHVGVVTHVVASTDPGYGSRTIADTTAAVTDDDAAGVTVTPTSGLSVEEGDPTTAQYLVRLDSEPAGTVTITVVDDPQVDVSTTTLTFTAADWNTPKPVDVSAFDDAVYEGPHAGSVSHLAGASDPADSAYDGIAVSPVAVGVVDDDTPGIEMIPASGLAATEGGTGASYQLRLESEPTADVTIAFSTGTQLQPIASMTFTSTDWNAYRTVVVDAVQDQVDEPVDPHAGTVSHTVTSADPTYAAWSLADQSVAITDDDTAAVTVDELDGLTLDEANVAATDTFTVVLGSEPVGTVTVTPTPDAQLTTSAAVTFDSTDWSVPKSITVTAIDDAVDETSPHDGRVTLAVTGDPRYASITPTDAVADVADDDTAALVVSAGSLALDEADPTGDTFTVRLASEPVAPITVTITTDAQATTATPTRTFTPSNWNVDQAVTITPVDDPTVEDDPHPSTVQVAATGGDPAYTSLAAETKAASIADDDVPGVTIGLAGGVAVTEGTGTDQYTVVLDAQPQADVDVAITPDSQVLGVPTTLTFTPADWNVAQPVTVTAVDDDVDEGTGTHPGGVTHAVSSTDPHWAAITTADPVAVAVTDDDVANVTITAASPYALDEDTPAPGTTVTYAVVLDSEPVAPVTIDLTVPGDLDASPTSLTFDSTNWNSARTVTVGAIDDAVTETAVHTRTITHAVTTGDATYAALTPASVAFDVTDNDIPGILVSESALTATEGGADDSFDVVLDTQPTGDVTIDLTSTQVGVDLDPITFTSADWNLPRTVTVTAVDDLVDEHPDTHAGLVELDVTSTDSVYHAWPLADLPVAITDDDTAGVTIAPGATPVAVAEAGATTATYTVVLDTQPTAGVTITPMAGDGQTTTAPASLSFTPATWNMPQPVTVTAVDDPDDEAATHPGVVTHGATSADPHYDATLAIASQAVDVADDDTAGITVTPTSGLALDEAAPATTATFSVRLDSRPLGDVEVTIATPDGQATAAPAPLTFTPATWNVSQAVTVSVVDDDRVEAATHAAVVEVGASSAADAAYAAIDPPDVTATVADDDVAGLVVTESGGSTDVDEGATSDTYLVRLRSQPTADVTVDITGGPDASTTPVQLTFTATNWNVDQSVTVDGTPDFAIEGAHTQPITHATSSADPDYDAMAGTPTVTATVTDDDAAGATITPTSVDVNEGSPGVTATYDVVLDAEPTQPVTITITPDTEVAVSTPSLVFSTTNWNVPQSVTVTADDDAVDEPTTHPGTITHAMSSTDPDFNVAVADVTANITDDDEAGVTITPTSTTVTEGGSGSSFSVVLDSMPAADVDVTFTEGGQLAPVGTITFTPATWNVAKVVSITAANDFVAEGAHATTISADTASSDTSYAPGALTIDDVAVSIFDDDVASVLVTPSSGLSGSEGGAPATYAVSLTSQPTSPVTITLAGDADVTPTPATLTFTAATWSTPQDIDVAITQDAIAEGTHSGTVSHVVASADANYDAFPVGDQATTIADDDSAGVTFTPTLPGPLAITEGGAGASYTVRLTSEPTDDVTIDIASLGAQATAMPDTLTFTAADWMTAQVVAVTAVDDPIAEAATHTDQLTHTAGGADATYAAMPLGDMDLDITDDDVPGVLVDATLPDTSVAEGGLGDTVRVRLATQPAAPVDVTLGASQVALGGSSVLTFTPSDWNVPQDVAVDAIQDDVAEGMHAGTIDALAGSVGDPMYAGVAATQHAVTVSDDDTAGVIVTQASPDTLDETTPLVGRDYAVRLRSEPVGSVDVTIAPDAQVTTSPTTLTFTAANWNVDQPVTVTPVNDTAPEPTPHPGEVTHDTIGSDPNYATGTLTIDPATFSVDDDDTPGVTVTPTAPHAVVEGGATSTYDIVLDSQPTSTVTIAPVSTQLEWTVPSITFDAANWTTPQTVTLRAVDDSFDEPEPHAGTIVHAITTADTGYQPVLAADVSASIGDDDVSDLVATPAGSMLVDEAGVTTAQYVLTLTSQPTADVTVALTSAAPAQVTTVPANVTLTATNWNTGVTVDVTGVPDDVQELDPHVATINHAMTSADANFGGETGPDQDVDVDDDDLAGVSIVASGGSTDVAEGGAVDSYDVVLTSQPTADVTITLATPGSQVAVTPSTLTFTALDWNSVQTVDVGAVQDSRYEGPGSHPGTITHAVTSGDGYYAAATAADVVANVLDDDVPGVVVTPAGGTFEVAEAGAPDQLVVTLATEPDAPVTIELDTPDGEASVTPTQVVLDATNWNTGATVDVTAVDDGFIEGTHSADVTFTIDAAASDDAYDAVTVATVTAQVTDDDAASVEVDPGDGLTLDEAAPATTDTFSVQLGASPAAGQTVDVDLGELAPGGQLTIVPTSLTFTDATWNVPQDVTVTVVDDDVDEADAHTGTVDFTVTSTDGDFDGLAVADADVAIADDDTSELVVTPATTSVAEAGTTSDPVEVSLATKPSGTVEVAVAGDAQVAATGTLTFTTSNWNAPQPVTVTALDDPVDEDDPHPGHVTFDVSSPAGADPIYDALATVDRTVDVADDDTSDVVVTRTAGSSVDEADPAATVEHSLALATRPSGDVTVTLVPDAQLEAVGSTTLTFTTTNWASAQSVLVRAADDQVADGSPHPGLLAFEVTSTDARYDAVTPAAETVDVLDDDVAGVSVLQGVAPAPLAEDGSTPDQAYDVVLTSQPIDAVEVTLAPDAQVEVTGGGTNVLTFTAADWNVPQTVSIAAVDDPVSEIDPHPGIVAHTSDSAGDSTYAAAAALTIADAEFTIDDDDQPGFTLDPAAPALSVDESGATSQSYTLRANTVPAGDVLVEFATTSADVTVSPASHTFDASNAATPVTITVTAVDDALVDPGEQAIVTHVVHPSSHAAYLAAPPIPDVTADVADDDAAGVLVDVLDGVAVAEAGATTDTFEVRLAAQPAQDVTVSFASDVTQLEDLSGATLTFTPALWNVAQPVTVQAKDDALVEADPHVVSIATTTSSLDAAFDALTAAPTDVTIDEDDVPAFVVTDPADMTMDEADAAGTERVVRVALTTAPTTPVTVTALNDGQLAYQSFNVFTLDSSNWSTGVPLTVRAIDDQVDEVSPHDGVVSFAVAAGSDPAYASLTIPPRTFQVADDDLASIACTAGANWNVDAAGQVAASEDPDAAEHSVTCWLQPGSDLSQPVTVDVSVAPGGQLAADRTSIVFPAGSPTSEPVTFTVADDAVAEGAHGATISFEVSSADPFYDLLTIAPVVVDIADDDAVGVTLTPAGALTLTEGGAGTQVAVALTSQPTGPVVVDVAGDAQVAANPASLTFLPTTWNVPQQVMVSAIDDPVDEPDGHAGQVAVTITTTETSGYAGYAVAPIAATITDNDTPGVVLTASGGSTAVAEAGATDTFTLQLGTRPTDDVTVTLDPGGQLTAVPATVTFTAATWDDVQAVTIGAVQDQVVEAEHVGTVTFTLGSNDAAYGAGSAATPAGHAVTITDDDLAGVAIVETESKTDVTEAGGTDTYTVVLTGAPTADVAIAIDGGAQVTAAPASLAFTSANWDQPQTVTVTAVQDVVDEADPHPAELRHVATTSAAGWAGANLTGVVANVADDDVANVVVGQSEGATRVAEGGKGDTLMLALSSQPTADVTVAVKGDVQLEAPTKPIVLTPAKWKDPIKVDVSAIDDDEVEGEHEGLLTLTVTSSDTSYRKATVPAITVTVGDNDHDRSTNDTTEDEQEEDEPGTRGPRAGVPPATVDPTPDDGGEQQEARRTSEGAERTDAGSERTPAGLSGIGGSAKQRDEVEQPVRRLGGEVVAAEEEEKPARKRPTVVAKVANWMADNWQLAALIVGGGVVVAGTGAWIMRADPIKAAQRASGSRTAVDRTRRASTGRDLDGRPRRVGRKKKRDDDEDDDGASGASGATARRGRRPPGRPSGRR